MKKTLILLVAGLFLNQAVAQVQDDTNGWLYRLCKTWGFVKYNSQHKCGQQWDNLLNATINEVLAADNITEFNDVMLNFLNQVGPNYFIQDPPTRPDTNLLVNTEWINDPVFSSTVKTNLQVFSSRVYPDSSTCLVRYNDYSNPDYTSYIDFTSDPFTLNYDYGQESHRLTVMFYYWNVINYFFPYRNLMDQPWDKSLEEFIPMIRKASGDLAFQKVLLKLVTCINDSHGFYYSDTMTSLFWKGFYLPPILFERVDNKCVVKKVEDIEGIEKGDILTAVDGITIKELEDSLGMFLSASTPASLYRDIYYGFLLGSRLSDIELTLTNSYSQSNTIKTSRIMTSDVWMNWIWETNLEKSFIKTTCGYGYVDMAKLTLEEIPAMYDSLKSSPAIIFDLRNYPNNTLWALVPYFFQSPIATAVFWSPALNSAEGYENYMPGWYNLFSNENNFGTWSNPDAYPGKVYLLVNQETQSHAEFTCQTLSYHPNAKVIGTQTAGADGNVSYLNLPGGITTYFTSLGVYYADGYQQQRNGVRIDSVVTPTIQGIREGKDEILLAAFDCISGTKDIIANKMDIKVYPNPLTSGSVRVSFRLENTGNIQLSLVDATGNTIKQTSHSFPAGDQDLQLDLANLPSGLYFLKANTQSGTATQKIVIRRNE